MKTKRNKFQFQPDEVTGSRGWTSTPRIRTILNGAGVTDDVVEKEVQRAFKKLAKRLDKRIRKAQKRGAKAA